MPACAGTALYLRAALRIASTELRLRQISALTGNDRFCIPTRAPDQISPCFRGGGNWPCTEMAVVAARSGAGEEGDL